MRPIKRTRPRPKGDRFGLMREANVGNLPTLVPKRTGKKYRDPEEILQGEVNDYLAISNQFHFRLSAHVLSKAHDDSVAGWPDNPLISRLQPGLALLGPLELKKQGEDLSAGQVQKQILMGTVVADKWETAESYIKWYWKALAHVRRLLDANPIPPAPSDRA